MTADFDEVLEELGHFGRYQQLNYALFFLPIFLSSAFTMSFAFTTAEPHYRCLVPECEGRTAPFPFSPSWLANAVPMGTEGEPKTCERYAVNPDVDWTNGSCPTEGFFKNTTWDCDEFVFDGKEVTILNEFNLTCVENKWKLTLVGTINNLGQFFGLPIAGFLSDRFGRRTVMVSAIVMSSICGIAKSFAPNYPTYVSIEFLEPLMGSAVYPSAFILALELVGPSRRGVGATFINVSYTLGVAYLALMAWALPNWRHMLLALYAPGIVLVSYFWAVPESIRWLMSNGRMRAAGRVVRKAAARNGVVLSDTILSIFDKTGNTEESSGPEKLLVDTNPGTAKAAFKSVLREIVTSKRLGLRLAINCVCWIVVTVVYYGLSIGSVSLFGDKYMNFAMVTLAEIPGSLLMLTAIERIGRRFSLAMAFTFSAMACIAVPFLPSSGGSHWFSLAVFLLGKAFITMAFNILYTYSAEMFPTSHRSSLLSACSTCGRIGSMLAPQAPLLAIYGAYLPFAVFGGTSLLAGGLSLFLPETLRAKLPDTVKEAEELGRKPMRTLSLS